MRMTNGSPEFSALARIMSSLVQVDQGSIHEQERAIEAGFAPDALRGEVDGSVYWLDIEDAGGLGGVPALFDSEGNVLFRMIAA